MMRACQEDTGAILKGLQPVKSMIDQGSKYHRLWKFAVEH